MNQPLVIEVWGKQAGRKVSKEQAPSKLQAQKAATAVPQQPQPTAQPQPTQKTANTANEDTIPRSQSLVRIHS